MGQESWRRYDCKILKAARVGFFAGMPLPKDIDALSPAELKSLVLRLLEKVAELERTVAAQRDEIARLKGGPPRPNIKPSGMEQASNPKQPGSSNPAYPAGCQSDASVIMGENGSPRFSDDASRVSASFPR